MPNSGDGQAMLDTGGADLYGPVRRVERACQAAVAAAALDPVDQAAAALAIELGRAVDIASRRPDPYGVAMAGRELAAVLARLRLDPVSRGVKDANDELDDFLATLSAPSGDAS